MIRSPLMTSGALVPGTCRRRQHGRWRCSAGLAAMRLVKGVQVETVTSRVPITVSG